VQFEEIERGPAVAVADQGLGHGFAEAVDIEGLARREVGDAGDRLGRALEVGAAPGDEAFLLRDRPPHDGHLPPT
jgi:hypothetical protein